MQEVHYLKVRPFCFMEALNELTPRYTQIIMDISAAYKKSSITAP